jgi:hypothetical protein
MSEAYSNFEEKHEAPEVDTQADETTDEEVDDQVEEEVEETEETEEEETSIVGPLFPPTYLKSLYLLVVNCLRSFMEPKPKSF